MHLVGHQILYSNVTINYYLQIFHLMMRNKLLCDYFQHTSNRASNEWIND
jgi:hypothetical protein